MVGLGETSKFMNYDTINDKHQRFYKSPIEIDIIVYGAGVPKVAIVDDLNLGKIDSKFASVTFDSCDNFFLWLF